MTGDGAGDAVEVLAAALGDLHRVLRRLASRRTGRAPLPDAQVELLRLVERHPGISVKEAAERLRTAANTVSTLVGDLAEAGLLARGRDPDNRRVVRLRLTDSAYGRIAEYGAHRRDLLLEALDRLDEPARRDIVRAAPQLRRLAGLVAEREAGGAAGPVAAHPVGGPEPPQSVGRDGAGGAG